MKRFLISSIPLTRVATPFFTAFATCGGLSVLMLSGCGGKSEGNAAQSSNPVESVAIAAAPTPVPTLIPTPTPTPAHSIPNWARGKVIRSANTTKKLIALTFDDGPWPVYTEQILAILSKNDIKATFFMCGGMAKLRPELVRKVHEEGHTVANHTWSHPSRPRDPQSEVRRTDAFLKQETGYTPTLFRPPYGLLKNGLAKASMQDKQSVVLWSSDSSDWSPRATVSSITSNSVNNAGPGGIILMHDGGGNRHKTVTALPRIISTLRGRGYSFVTVPKLLEQSQPPAGPKPKKKPSKASKTTAKKAKPAQD